MEMGESIVASYLRYVEGCDIVLHNTYAGEQAEIDVVGIKLANKVVILSEVATHILGLNYGKGNSDTLKRVEAKIARARGFAATTFRTISNGTRFGAPWCIQAFSPRDYPR